MTRLELLFMFKVIFAEILKLIECEFNNKLFGETTEALMQEIPEDTSIESVRLAVAPFIYQSLIEIHPSLKDKIIVNENETSLLNLTFFNKDGLVIFRLKDTMLEYLMELILTNMAGESKRINLHIKDEESKLEIINQQDDNGLITNYDHEIVYYDALGTKIDKDTELEKDYHFSLEFCLPLKDARKYRLNFQENAEFLNRNRYININRSYEENLKDNLFHSPFNIDDLEIHLLSELDKEVAEIYQSPYHKMPHQKTGKLDSLLSSLKNLLGASEEIIISDNLYQTLSYYLFDLTSGYLYNKGIIIKKLNGEYTLYYLHLDNDQIIGVPEILTKEDVDLIFASEPANYNVIGLQEFFGLTHNRH